jgi:hypothetical protein
MLIQISIAPWAICGLRSSDAAGFKCVKARISLRHPGPHKALQRFQAIYLCILLERLSLMGSFARMFANYTWARAFRIAYNWEPRSEKPPRIQVGPNDANFHARSRLMGSLFRSHQSLRRLVWCLDAASRIVFDVLRPRAKTPKPQTPKPNTRIEI